jgi:MFS transporter, PPP family, 3-phenylpropionic acid transporter
VPFLNVYFARKGLSGAEIGWLNSIPPLVALGANPVWGALADRWQVHRLVLALCSLMGGAVSLGFLAFDSFWTLMLVVVLLAFFRTPIGSLVDSAVVDMTRRVGAHYGQQRMWGSVGFVIATLALGQILSIDNLDRAFWIHWVLLGLVCTGLSFMLPISSTPGRVDMLGGIKRLASQRTYLSFLAAMAVLGLGTSSYVNFLGLRMVEIGGAESMIGIAWAANGLFEFPMMLLGPRLFGRWRYANVMQLGFFLYTLVWLFIAWAQSPWLLAAGAGMIGMCYGMLWVAAVNHANEAAPPGLSATAQALVGAAQSGIGWGLGSIMSGYLWDGFGGEAVFVAAALSAVVAGLLFWLGHRGLGHAHVDA